MARGELFLRFLQKLVVLVIGVNFPHQGRVEGGDQLSGGPPVEWRTHQLSGGGGRPVEWRADQLSGGGGGDKLSGGPNS